MQNQNNKTTLLVMDLQNGIVSRFSENKEVLLPFQKAVIGLLMRSTITNFK